MRTARQRRWHGEEEKTLAGSPLRGIVAFESISKCQKPGAERKKNTGIPDLRKHASSFTVNTRFWKFRAARPAFNPQRTGRQGASNHRRRDNQSSTLSRHLVSDLPCLEHSAFSVMIPRRSALLVLGVWGGAAPAQGFVSSFAPTKAGALAGNVARSGKVLTLHVGWKLLERGKRTSSWTQILPTKKSTSS